MRSWIAGVIWLLVFALAIYVIVLMFAAPTPPAPG